MQLMAWRRGASCNENPKQVALAEVLEEATFFAGEEARDPTTSMPEGVLHCGELLASKSRSAASAASLSLDATDFGEHEAWHHSIPPLGQDQGGIDLPATTFMRDTASKSM